MRKSGKIHENTYLDTVMTVDEVCRYLKIGRNSVYRLLKTGELKSKKIGARYVITSKNLEEFLEDENIV